VTEAKVSIDGKELTGAQTMAIRIALDHFTSVLREKGLGLDEHGRAMTAAYLERLEEVRNMMAESSDTKKGHP
jgi:hypothetical protein